MAEFTPQMPDFGWCSGCCGKEVGAPDIFSGWRIIGVRRVLRPILDGLLTPLSTVHIHTVARVGWPVLLQGVNKRLRFEGGG